MSGRAGNSPRANRLAVAEVVELDSTDAAAVVIAVVVIAVVDASEPAA